MIVQPHEGSSEGGSWYYAQSDDTGTSVQNHDSSRVEQAQIETNTAPVIGFVLRPYDTEANALLSVEV